MSREQRRVIIQAALFVLTFITTTLAGAEWAYDKPVPRIGFTWQDFLSGLPFSVPLLLILTTHEFGHYFAAMYHKVKATLPYYIPMPTFQFSIGTMGAVIRLESKVYSKKQNFDIGIAGPLAGFVMALIVLFYGFTHLPEPEYIFQIHPEFEMHGLDYAKTVYAPKVDTTRIGVTIGRNLVFLFFENVVADPLRVPNPHEIMHYPILVAGYVSLMFTFLNLLPIGQLDGGHVLYGLFGLKSHRTIASYVFVIFLFYSCLGFFSNELVMDANGGREYLVVWIAVAVLFLYLSLSGLGFSQRNTLIFAVLFTGAILALSISYPDLQGYPGWLLFLFIIGKFIGIPHPPSEIEEPLDSKRIVLGWVALIIFILCFSPAPLQFIEF